ncbi:MAG: M48 family metallopeptidase, partial [Lachnospiraceae bacterium]|nr:M48 family metallopeptidase [Lachnospiraceae bacterium]
KIKMEKIEYTFVRSKRKTIGITVKADQTVILKAPLRCSQKRAEEFLLKNLDWIEKTRLRLKSKQPPNTQPFFTPEELKQYKIKARKEIIPMVDFFADRMGVDYNRIAIRAQKSRWGSCSSGSNLNFNCLLVLLPHNVQRYVVIHELCHLRHMNHSTAFWNEVAVYCPTYKEDRKQLKKEGGPLIARIPDKK